MSAAAKVMKRPGGVAGLQGPRPQPLSLPAAASSSARPSKRPRGDDGVGGGPGPGPDIVYERTPRVIHARPDEFKALVQRLTGQQHQRATGDQEPVPPAAEPAPSSSQEEETTTTAATGDPLVLTLGQQQAPPPPLDDRSSAGLLSPGAAGFLLSPGSFLFSPATMQAIQELISS